MLPIDIRVRRRAKNGKEKAPVLLEDEGRSRIVVPPPFTR
jgi:hypothetical protein